MIEQEEFTWRDLKNVANNLPEDQLDKKVIW